MTQGHCSEEKKKKFVLSMSGFFGNPAYIPKKMCFIQVCAYQRASVIAISKAAPVSRYLSAPPHFSSQQI